MFEVHHFLTVGEPIKLKNSVGPFAIPSNSRTALLRSCVDAEEAQLISWSASGARMLAESVRKMALARAPWRGSLRSGTET
jgi:hypothetical protein